VLPAAEALAELVEQREQARARVVFHGDYKYCHNGGMGFAPNQLAASARQGSMKAHHGPSPWSPERAVMQGKSRAVRDPCPLGAAMDSSASVHAREVLPQRGAFALHHGVGLPGVHHRDHGPFRRSPENSGFAGGKATGSGGSVPFGGSNGLVCLLETREKYCHNGGMALRGQVGMGAVIAPFDPITVPLPETKNPCKSGLNLAQGCRGRTPLGAKIGGAGFFSN
jgi:hypothetical protein